jgi:hypothetical protein
MRYLACLLAFTLLSGCTGLTAREGYPEDTSIQRNTTESMELPRHART